MMTNSTNNTIAIVDDDSTFRLIFSVQLMEMNDSNNILQFEDGLEMLEFLLVNKENPTLLPDIIFLDLQMKQVDGWVFLEEFEETKKYLHKDIQIHIITGSSETKDKLKAKATGLVTDFITKPIDLEEIKKCLGNH
jgi:CheY-like chemotaxis protein